MQVLGDFRTGATVRLVWNTNAVAGESITRATNGSIRIYKNGSTTERTSSAGITDTEDFDTLTGVHHLSIDLSDNTDVGFYAAGNDYFLVLQGATIDGKTINAGLASFSIENRNPQVDVTKWLGTAAATPTVAGVPEVDVTHFNGTAGTFAAGRPEVNTTHWGGTAVASANVRANLVQILGTAPTEGGAGRLAGAFTTLFDVAAPVLTTASVNQTGDSFARLGAPVGVSISADVAGVQSDTNDIQTRLPAALISGRMDSNVQVMATGVVTASAIAPDAIGASELAADAVAEIAGAVWDELRSGHVLAGSFGAGVASVQGNVTGSVGSVTGAVGSVTGNVGGNVVGSVASVTAAVTVGTNNDKTGYALTASERNSIADALLDRADAIETGLTPRQSMRLIVAADAGKLSGAATTTIAIRNAVADSKARITATVDASGNRSAITYDVS